MTEAKRRSLGSRRTSLVLWTSSFRHDAPPCHRPAGAAARRHTRHHGYASPLEPCAGIRAARGGHFEGPAALGGRKSHAENASLLRARFLAAGPDPPSSAAGRGARSYRGRAVVPARLGVHGDRSPRGRQGHLPLPSPAPHPLPFPPPPHPARDLPPPSVPRQTH